MIFQKHELHGYHISANVIEAKANEENGWETISEGEFYDRGKIGVKAEQEEPAEAINEEIPRSVLDELYEAKFGEKPHHRMKDETIKEKLDADNP